MTPEEFRADLLAAAASRAAIHATGVREAFVSEVLERLREAGEVPEADICAEKVDGNRGRRLEIDAFAFDEADESLHLFIALFAGTASPPQRLTITDAREHGFNRVSGVYTQSRDGWLVRNIEESRPLWDLAQRIGTGPPPAAVRLHVLSDRPVSERVREIPVDESGDVPVTFQIWDATRLQRIHEARSVRDDLVVDFSGLPGGGLAVLPAAVGHADYDAYLAVIPGDVLADIYIRHGSRLLEANVRTFLGRGGRTNKGIAQTLEKQPSRFFAYNNGITATAAHVTTRVSADGGLRISQVVDLQIVNGAQTTASLGALKREKKLPSDSVFVPMKLSVVAPEVAEGLVQEISRCANSQNAVKQSDFFANHPFHLRLEEKSRRILAPAIGGSQIQTHWYYERARGQHLNDQSALTPSKKEQFLRLNPKSQVITKTDLAKVETAFSLQPDISSKGSEKAFIAFADRVADDWEDEPKRSLYSDDWYKGAVARVILFRATEHIVSRASWYEAGKGWRPQVVAYTAARLVKLAQDQSDGGRLDYLKIWAMQGVDDVLERQIAAIAEAMNQVLLQTPQEGQNVGEWAKQQACRKRALETAVQPIKGFDRVLVERADARSDDRKQRDDQRVADEVVNVSVVVELEASYWKRIRLFAGGRRIASREDDLALTIACAIPRKIPTGFQAARLLDLKRRCEEAGFGE